MASLEEKHKSRCSTKSLSTISFTSKERPLSSQADEEQQALSQPEWKPSKQVKFIVVGQSFVVFAISLDLSILTTTLPTVAHALNANAIQSFWIASSYLLANAIVQPVMAGLADIFGRRSVIFTALWLFTIGSIVCCASDTVTAMLVGRTIQGIGGGGVLSINLIILSDLIPLRERAKYISFQQLVVSVGLNIAPIVGGALVQVTTWRWLFYINFPFCAIGLTIIPFALRYQRPQTSAQEKLSSVDWFGSASFILGMTAFLVGMTWGGVQYAWTSAATLVPLIGGLAVIVATGFYERFFAKTTFLRLSLFHTWSAVSIYFCSVIQAMCLFTEVYFLCMYLMSVKLYSPLSSGIYLLAFCAVCVPVSGAVGPLIARIGAYRWAIWSGWVMNTTALGLLNFLDVDTPTFAWVLLFVTAGLGQGMLFIAHSIASQAACQQKDAAHAMAMYSFTRSLGLCFGVALGGAIFQNFLQGRLSNLDLPVEIAKNSEAYAFLLRNIPDTPERGLITRAYAAAFERLFTTLCGVSAFAMIVAFTLIKGHTLNRTLESEHFLHGTQTEEEQRLTELRPRSTPPQRIEKVEDPWFGPITL